ncbi:MAG: hypothetical protein ACPGYX_05245 [Oceanobacter sp.]
MWNADVLTQGAAWVYSTGALMVVLFHIALISGQPWGHLTMGGQWSGELPPAGKVTSAIQILLIIWMQQTIWSWSSTADDSRGVLDYLVFFLAGLSVLGNAATHSPKERALWLPVVTLMLACIIVLW